MLKITGSLLVLSAALLFIAQSGPTRESMVQNEIKMLELIAGGSALSTRASVSRRPKW